MPSNLFEPLERMPAGHAAYLLLDNSAYDGVWLTQNPKKPNSPARFGPLISKLKRCRVPCAALWGDLGDPETSAVAPLLIQWPDGRPGAPLVDALQSMPPGRCAQSILYSDEPMDALLQALRKRTRISVLGDDYLLRYFDTRVLAELMECLTPGQHRSFLSLAQGWHYRDRDDSWQSLACVPAPGDPYSPLELDDGQVDAVLRIGSADRIDSALDRLLDDNSLDRLAPTQRHEWIRARQKDASSRQIAEHSGQLRYCLMALQAGEQFHRDPEWEETLSQLRTPQPKI